MYAPVVPSKNHTRFQTKMGKVFSDQKRPKTPTLPLYKGVSAPILTPFMIVRDRHKVQKWVKKIAF